MNVVVTCTNRKFYPVAPHHRLRVVRARNPHVKSRLWLDRLRRSDVELVDAERLYAGEHWSIACSLSRGGPSDLRVRLWIASAGYGLVRADALLKPYSATFASGHLDSVPGSQADWWSDLANWEGPQPGEPRTLRDVARAHPATPLLLVLSASYLEACARDAADAAFCLRRRDLLAIISAGSRATGPMSANFLPCDARLQHAFGGTRQSLNIRAVDFVLGQARNGFSVEDARDLLAKTIATQPPVHIFDRTRLSDGQVRKFIRSRLAEDPEASRSRLLSALRGSGNACEQNRFAALYEMERYP